MRPGRLSGAGMAIMASPRHDGDVGDAVHPRTARGPAAGPRIADAARYRRDAQGDLAAQAGGKRGAGRAHQRTPRAPPRRHRIPLPHSTQKGFGIDKAVTSECDSVKLAKMAISSVWLHPPRNPVRVSTSAILPPRKGVS